MINKRQEKIEIIYSRLKHLISQIPLEKDKPAIEDSTVHQFHSIVDKISSLTGEDYSEFKVPLSERENWANFIPPEYYWKTTPVRAKIMDLIGQIGKEYDTEHDNITLRRLLKEEVSSLWHKYRDKTIFAIVVIIFFLLVYLLFRINLFGLIGIDLGL